MHRASMRPGANAGINVAAARAHRPPVRAGFNEARRERRDQLGQQLGGAMPHHTRFNEARRERRDQLATLQPMPNASTWSLQ